MPAVTTIQLRRGTSNEWFNQNPKLADGEVGYETDTGKFKVGNGNNFWNDTALKYATDTSKLVGGLSGNTITSGAVPIAYGGTGLDIGTSLVARATLSADRTRASASGTEAVFFDAGATTAQYLRLEKDTTYSFDGYVQYLKGTTSVLPTAAIQYYTSAAGTNANSPQYLGCQIATRAATLSIGFIDITAVNVNTNVASSGTANTGSTFSYHISGMITTNLNDGGRFALAIGNNGTLASAGTFRIGSTLSVYKHGAGNTVNFGNWGA